MAARTLTRFDSTMVRLADGSVVRVRRGRPLPDGLADGEQARLESAGAFDDPPVEQTVTVVADLAGDATEVAAAASAAAPAPGTGAPTVRTTVADEPDDTAARRRGRT